MSVSYLLKYIFYVFIMLFSFSSLSCRYQGLIRSPGPEFARLFHDNPACRTPVISNPKTIFFPNSASCAKIFSESCLSSDGQFPYPVNKFRVFPNPASRVKSRIPRNFFQTLQDQLGVYICCIHAYDKASALQGI